MRWIVLLLAISLPVQAQWVQFEACGLEPPPEKEALRSERTIKAPESGPHWIYVPAITYVMGFTEKGQLERGMMACTLIGVQGTRILVIGTLQETIKRIEKAKRMRLDKLE